MAKDLKTPSGKNRHQLGSKTARPGEPEVPTDKVTLVAHVIKDWATKTAERTLARGSRLRRLRGKRRADAMEVGKLRDKIAAEILMSFPDDKKAFAEKLVAAFLPEYQPNKKHPKTMKDVVEARSKSRRPLAQLGTAKDVVIVLGGPKIVGTEVKTDNDLMRLNEKGLPFEAGQYLRVKLGLTAAELAELTAIAPRTISRRKAGRFNAHESERLIRIARILAIASQVLENEERAVKWLRQPNRTLGGRTPLSNARLENGARQVENLLGALEHGVYR